MQFDSVDRQHSKVRFETNYVNEVGLKFDRSSTDNTIYSSVINIELETGIGQGAELKPARSPGSQSLICTRTLKTFYMTLQFGQLSVEYPSAKSTFVELKWLYKRLTKVIGSQVIALRTKLKTRLLSQLAGSIER